MENLIESRLVSPCKNCEKTGNRKICSKNCKLLENFRRKVNFPEPLVPIEGRNVEGISNGRRIPPVSRLVVERY